MADFVLTEYGKQGVPLNRLVKEQKKMALKLGKRLSYSEAVAEVVADSMQLMFTDENALQKMQKLKQTDHVLYNKIKGFFIDLYNRITAAYKGLKPNSKEAKAFLEMSKGVRDKISYLFSDALVDAGEAFGQATDTATKNPTVDGGVKYSNRIELNTDNIVNSFGISNINDYIHVQNCVYNTLKNESFFGDNNSLSLTNLSSGMLVEVNKSGIFEAFNFENYTKQGKKLKHYKLATIRNVPEIISNGTLVDDNVPNIHDKNSGLKYAYIVKDIIIDGKKATVTVAIRKSNQKNKFWMHKISIKENTESLPTGTNTSSKIGYQTFDVNTTIPQSESGVNTHSMQNSENDTSGIKYSPRASLEEDAEVKENSERLFQLKTELREKAHQAHEASKKVTELEKSEEYKSLLDIIHDKSTPKEKIDEVISQIEEWQEKSGYKTAKAEYQKYRDQEQQTRREISNIEKELHDALKEQIKEFDDEEVKGYVSKAVRKYHTTSKLSNASYLLTTGSMLDFSEGQGYRVKDHREISEILGLPDYAEYSDGMIAFMNMGNIRLQSYGIDISKAPNGKQVSALRAIISQVMRDTEEFTVDFSKTDGNNDGSVTYSKGVSSSRIISDINQYFETGIIPEYDSGLTQFMFSPRGTIEETIDNLSNSDIIFLDKAEYRKLNSIIAEVHPEDITSRTTPHYNTVYTDKYEYRYAVQSDGRILAVDRRVLDYNKKLKGVTKDYGRNKTARLPGGTDTTATRIGNGNKGQRNKSEEMSITSDIHRHGNTGTSLSEMVEGESGSDTAGSGVDVGRDTEHSEVSYQFRPEYTPREALADALKEITQGRAENAVKNGLSSQEALDTLAVTKAETEALERYQKRIKQLNKDSEQLNEIRKQIAQLSFSEGADKSELAKLNNRREILENKINRQDKELLNLESTKIFKDIVTKEKSVLAHREQEKYAKLERKLAQQKVKDAERLDKKIKSLKEHNAEVKERAKDRHDRSTMRERVIKNANALTSLLTTNTKERHVPLAMQEFVQGLCM